MNDVATRLTACFAGVFPSHSSDMLRSGSINTIEGWNSLAMIQLIVAIEEEFAVRFNLEDAANLTSFSQFLAYVQQHSAKDPQ